MFRFVLKETDEYDRLVEFMKPFGLEFDNDDKLETKTLKCWKVVQDPDYLVGGIILSMRSGEYYINGIAVDPPMRRTGIGKIMMDKAIKEVRKLGGKRIYLVAKVPEFFASLGFTEVKAEDAPNVSLCPKCRQFNETCFPKIMKLEL